MAVVLDIVGCIFKRNFHPADGVAWHQLAPHDSRRDSIQAQSVSTTLTKNAVWLLGRAFELGH